MSEQHRPAMSSAEREVMVLPHRAKFEARFVDVLAVILLGWLTVPSWSLAQHAEGKLKQVELRTIAGRVVDENDKPVEGAHIVWHVAFGKPEVFVEATSDSEGRFVCSTPDVRPKLPTWAHDTLWVYKKGKRLTTANTWRDEIHDGKLQQLEVRLLEDALVTYTVVSSEQKPLANVIIEPWHFLTHMAYDIVPPSVRKLMRNKSDRDGHVQVSQFDQKTLFTIHAISRERGTQQICVEGRTRDGGNLTIELLPAGALQGQLIADDPELVKDIEVYVTTLALNNRLDEGFAQVTTDDKGRFNVPAIPAGTLRIAIPGGENANELPRIPAGQVKPDELLVLDIPYEPAVVVWGTIHTDDTNQPVPGAVISVRYGTERAGSTVVSDEDGDYHARVLAGDVYTQVISIPKDFSDHEQLGSPWNEKIKVPLIETAFELPAIRLDPTRLFEGKVLLHDGTPAAKMSMNGVHQNRRYGFTTTGQAGEFSMRLPMKIDVKTIQIWPEDNKGPLDCEVEQKDPLVLRAKPRPQ